MEALVTFTVVVAAVFGLVVGSFLNVVAYRVPAGISLLRESRCPHCNAAVRPWQNVPVVSWIALRGKCSTCGEPISVRYPLVEAATGIAFALVTWWILIDPSSGLRAAAAEGTGAMWSLMVVIMAYLYFVAISVVLSLIDLDTHRLPNSIVLPSYLVAAALLTVGSLLSGDWAALVRAGIGMVALYAFYFLLRLAKPGGMGGGDVKLAGLVGIYLGYIGWGALATGVFAAFVLGGIYGIALIALRRAGGKSRIPFGPWILLGAWVGLFTGEALGRWYVGLYTGA